MNRTTVGPNPAEAEEQTGLVTVLRWSWRLFSSDRRWRRRIFLKCWIVPLKLLCSIKLDEPATEERDARGAEEHEGACFIDFQVSQLVLSSSTRDVKHRRETSSLIQTNKQSKFLTEQKLSVEVDAEETSVPLLIQFIALFIFLNIWFYDRREFEDGDRNMKSTKQNHTYSVFTLLLEQNFKDKKLSSSHRPERRPDLQARHVFTTWCTAAQTLRTKLHNPRNDSFTVRSWSIRSDNICKV